MICCFLQKVPTRNIMSEWLILIIILYSPVLWNQVLHIENNCITHTAHDILPHPHPKPYAPPLSRWLGIHSFQPWVPDYHAGHRERSHDRKDRGTATGKGHQAAYHTVLFIMLTHILTLLIHNKCDLKCPIVLHTVWFFGNLIWICSCLISNWSHVSIAISFIPEFLDSPNISYIVSKWNYRLLGLTGVCCS